MEEKIKRNIRKQAKKYFKHGNWSNKRVVLFGCVPGAKLLRRELEAYHLKYDAVIDNNNTKWGQSCMGAPICDPAKVLEPFDENIIILIWSGYWREMVKQVEKMGYRLGKHIFVFFDSKPPESFYDSCSWLWRNWLAMRRGYRIYQRLKGAHDMVFLCPYKGTGDVYMAGRYFKEYIRRHDITDYVFLVVNGVGRKVASLFDIEHVEVISEKDSAKMLAAYDCYGPEWMSFKPLLYWGWRTKRMAIPRFCKQLNFNDMFRHDVYGLEKNVKGEKPHFKTSKETVDQFFQEHGLLEGKTIILSPYAGSFVSDIPVHFWELLAKRFQKLGYIVCTNSAGEMEPVIAGTKGLFFPLTDAVPIVERAGGFIGFRSGLCDIVSSANCKMMILYEQGFNASQYEFFSLVRMELCDNIAEIIYDNSEETAFLELVWKQWWERE